MLSAEKFAELIGTSRVTVNAKRQNHQVLGLEGAKRGFRFPAWQVGEDGKPFSALPELFDHLGGSSWAVYRFLLQHHPELDGLTGREALYQGRMAEVLEVAESVVRAAS
jgi:ribulose kinase